MKSTLELQEEQRPWEYDCDGTKTHKNNFTQIWTDEDEKDFLSSQLEFDFDTYGGGVENFATYEKK